MAGLACLIVLPASGQTNAWQQLVNHTIEVTLDDQHHRLHGGIRTEYVNHSPDTLRHLWIHIWPNAYANGKTALAQQQLRQGNMVMFWAMQRDLGGIDSLAFQVNNRPAQWSFHPDHIDIVRLDLTEPLLPGASLTYSTPFRVKLPSGAISRLGHIGQSYQITQWYPKPAVYDASGWHEMPYLNQGEFYSEYGAFDVTIHLPAAYTVGATGDFVPGFGDNDAEVVRLDALDTFTRQVLDGRLDPQQTPFPGDAPEGTMKTLRYRQDNVHDFAWFADQSWWVLKDSVQLARSGRTVTTWAMFTPEETEWWKKAPEYLNDATRLYSEWVGDYPYNHVTAVDGTISAGGGMEYPNVTVIGRTRSDSGLETVIVHEVGHNWFYGILGTNERTNAWMDEGINSYYETRYFEHKYGDALRLAGFGSSGLLEKLDIADLPYGMRDRLAYLLSAQMGIDQPMQCHSDDFADLNYGTIVYKKSAAAMAWLEDYLGRQRFDASMQSYFDRWKFRHPQPADLRTILDETNYESLDWFFDGVVATTDQYDVAIRGARQVETEDGPALRVKLLSRGSLQAPVSISAQMASDSAWTLLRIEPPLERGMRTRVDIPLREDRDWTVVRLDAAGKSLDVNRTNDTRRMHGLFRGIEPLRFRFATRLETPERTQVFWSPVVGGNQRDGFMAGLALHNSTVPLRRSEWLLMPMVGFGSGNLTGLARYSWRFAPAWRFEASAARWGESVGELYDYTNRCNELRIEGRFNRRPTSPWQSHASLSVQDIRKMTDWDEDAIIPFSGYSAIHRQALTVNGHAERAKGMVNQFLNVQARLAGETSNWGGPVLFASESQLPLVASFGTLQQQLTAEYVLRQTRNREKETWGIRAFAGMTGTSDGSAQTNIVPLTATGIGRHDDFLMDAIFTNRADRISSTAPAGFIGSVQGGIYGADLTTASLTAVSAGLVSLRVDWELPFLGAHIYAGGVFQRAETGAIESATEEESQFAAGLLWPIADGQIEIGLPLYTTAWSPDSKYEPWKSITLAVNLRDASPFKIARSALMSQR